jgi:hypothetical protein
MKIGSRRIVLAVLAASATATQAQEIDFSQANELVGDTIVGVFTITGYQDPDGTGKNQFDGCQYGRTIIFDDSKVLKCFGYSYHYAYRPEALVLVRGGDFKMLVDGEIFDMQN